MLDPEAYQRELDRKLAEELAEYQADGDLSELADLVEVGLTLVEFEATRCCTMQVGARSVLQDRLVDLYLYGSLALGDFDPGSSDIDFVVATDGDLLPEAVAALRNLHERLAARHPRWAAELVGSYIDQPDRLHDQKYHRYAVVTMCRVLVTLRLAPSPPSPRPCAGHGRRWARVVAAARPEQP